MNEPKTEPRPRARALLSRCGGRVAGRSSAACTAVTGRRQRFVLHGSQTAPIADYALQLLPGHSRVLTPISAILVCSSRELPFPGSAWRGCQQRHWRVWLGLVLALAAASGPLVLLATWGAEPRSAPPPPGREAAGASGEISKARRPAGLPWRVSPGTCRAVAGLLARHPARAQPEASLVVTGAPEDDLLVIGQCAPDGIGFDFGHRFFLLCLALSPRSKKAP
jgi:hypothetical protein